MKIRDSVAFVTGANRGIGLAFAQELLAGKIVGKTGDGGIDGIMTTSSFSPDALEYVQKIEKRSSLINGQQLADLMIDHDIGVNVIQTYRVRRLDSDYFDEA